MKRTSVLLLLSMTVLFSACIKEKYTIPIDDNTDRVLTEFTSAKDGVNSLALDFGTQMVEVDLTELRIPPRSSMANSVQVKIAVNNALATNEGFAIPSPGTYSLVTTDYTLTPTNRKVKVRLKVNPSGLIGDSYAIGLTIQQVSSGEINQAAKDIVIELKVKNDYEGEYAATGLLTAYAGANNTFPVSSLFDIDEDKYLYTIDQTTVETTAGFTAFTGAWMFLKIDPVTNNVTVMPSTLGPTFPTLSNNGPCAYDPATRTFTLNYKYFNGVGNLRTISETLVLK
ncbi:MAG TPA: DUF4361 domain-containing protein [Chitinophagaceae bacterium]|nr:DUF4361 domain-containing protein [Chitinophagaceae bacterium]